ncbi:MAG TPA: acetyltransferase [Candidatus Lustribacter sp.]|nr:acetyltransferase [Candidatus Lustribacter sp.]
MKAIVLWGATGHARVLAEFLGALDYGVVALVDNDPAVTSFLPGVPVLHGEAALREWRAGRPGEMHALVAVGGARGAERLALQQTLASAGYIVPSAVHPRAFVAGDVTLGAGSQILALAAVAAAARIGSGCIVNTTASVDHECRLDDGVHIGPGATLAGNVTVGRNAFIGTGAAVIPHITIGADAIVGAGAVVIRDVAPNTVVYGNPARPGKHRA